MINSRLLSCVVLLISLVSCSSINSATTSFRDGFDFSSVESYSTYGRNSAFGDLQNLNDTIRNTIELAIEQGFDENGFRYKISENADVMIAYHLLNQNFAELNKYNQQVKYCGYCLNAGKNSRVELETKLRPGSLILDIIDPKSQRTVWRSVYPLGFKAQDNSQEMQKKISNAVDNMLRDYPRGQNISQVLNDKGEFV
ncbi:DUF4136 domain-containing protein [Cognaticolwellia beringensis]|uniref:DUF4136 domain-containing protein n=1 Tax=Cognaticolwellia beringensis TaxID=1967665 RepID=A0A222G6Q7_9GAMM|nr:DUF4136 domain-containing protein [Cognaticolwellia beringensis]ASP47491.1 DUF4136 domain-containing protein [Cognaticolwellia beringensis]